MSTIIYCVGKVNAKWRNSREVYMPQRKILIVLSVFNAIFEVVVYVYGLSLAVFYITQFVKDISKVGAPKC